VKEVSGTSFCLCPKRLEFGAQPSSPAFWPASAWTAEARQRRPFRVVSGSGREDNDHPTRTSGGLPRGFSTSFEWLGTGLPGVGLVRGALPSGRLFRHKSAPGTSAGGAVGALAVIEHRCRTSVPGTELRSYGSRPGCAPLRLMLPSRVAESAPSNDDGPDVGSVRRGAPSQHRFETARPFEAQTTYPQENAVWVPGIPTRTRGFLLGSAFPRVGVPGSPPIAIPEALDRVPVD
jgi:hypothetical protein